jgi:bifunctional non-homologous end joining protein LigD
VRRKPHAPVSTPLDWTEVSRPLNPADFSLGNFSDRRNAKDPWRDFFASRQNFKAAKGELERL